MLQFLLGWSNDIIITIIIIIIIIIIITPLIFTTTGGMGEECQRYHSRLAELLANKKGERYSKTMAWIRAKISFSILRSALLCLRGSRVIRRVHCNAKDIDLDIETAAARIH